MLCSRPWRRVALTHRLVAGVVLVAGLLALAPVMPQTSDATVGRDDYPVRLRGAAQDSLVDPWSFYNRECTSFVAWRLNNDAGVDFHNYYLGVHWGNASNWKYAAGQVGILVDDTPQVGAVAWWAAGSAGSSRGHVAWVMGRTRSSITIEEYNYISAGHYDQRTISTTSSMWPSDFIHVGSRALRNTTEPTIDGTPKVGVKLTAHPGSWNMAGVSYTYQWLANGIPVRTATHRSFAPRASQLGERLRVRVSATVGSAKPVSATSSRSKPVAPGALVMKDRPTITGSPQVGVKLTATRGSWSPSGARFSYQWLSGGAPIDGATHRSFAPRADQLGKRLQVQVTASATAMEPGTGTSIRSVIVVPGELVVSTRPTITGTPQVDSQLSATSGTWSPNATYTYQWRTAGDPVDAAVASTFTPSAEQVGQRVSVRVTATRDGYTTASSSSVQTTAVRRATFARTGPPTIAGTAQVDQPLTASAGAWSPTGTPTYRWFVDGVAVPGATGGTYTPTTDDLRKQVTVKVTMTRPGYTTASASSAATVAVLPGTFRNTRDPSISGTPRVGLPLTADPGGWSPTPTLSYQWYAEGVAVRRATSQTFTPTSAELAKRITVEVTARRLGYLTALTESAATAKVTPGVIASVERPEISGKPFVGDTLTADAGTWNVRPTSVDYQWYADGIAISGASGSTYSLTRSLLDQRVAVRVTVSRDGYTPTSRSSAKTDPVVLGRAEFTTKPSLSGTPVVGRLLTADPGSFTPSRATPGYTWLRSGEPIADATGSTYRLAAADVGHRIAVLVTLTTTHWASHTGRTNTTTTVNSVPELDLTSSVSGRKVVLRLSVVAPGLHRPDGRAVVTERGERVGTILVSGGHGRLALSRVASGVHRYKVAYAGPLQMSRSQRIDVTIS